VLSVVTVLVSRWAFVQTKKAKLGKQWAQANFFVHGKPFSVSFLLVDVQESGAFVLTLRFDCGQFAPHSLFLFHENNRFRQAAVWLIQWRWFDRFILFLIIANSVTLGLTDYSLGSIDPNTMEPLASSTWRNQIPVSSEIIFLVLFTLEFMLKVIGRGFFMDKGSYLRDGWNWLDFVVVVSGLLSSIPNMPKVSMLRTLRVLRPLRSLTILPGMKMLVRSLLASIPPLMNVVVLLSFIFFVFGILGLQMWAGIMHSRCRLLEYPIRMSVSEVPLFLQMAHAAHASPTNTVAQVYMANVLTNATAYPRCVEAGLDDQDWTFESSPWHTPQDCVWPIDLTDTRLCSLDESGLHVCSPGTWCGSNYDRFGNPRFTHEGFMQSSNFVEELNFGFTNFDWFLGAFLTIFQAITMEGWVDILYQVCVFLHVAPRVAVLTPAWSDSRCHRATLACHLLRRVDVGRLVLFAEFDARSDLGLLLRPTQQRGQNESLERGRGSMDEESCCYQRTHAPSATICRKKPEPSVTLPLESRAVVSGELGEFT